MNIKKSPLMAGLLSLSAVFGSMAAKGYEGEIGVKEGCFDNAPVDKVLGVSNGFVWTYRSQAKYTVPTNTKEIVTIGGTDTIVTKTWAITNSAPIVRVSLDGKTGFASGSSIMPGIDGNALVNEQTGAIATADENGTVIVHTPKAGGLGGYSTATNTLAQSVNSSGEKLVNPIAYLYDPEHLIVFGANTQNTTRGYMARATKEGNQFIIDSNNGRNNPPYRPTMATQSDDKIYFSNGNSIIAYDAHNMDDVAGASIANGIVKAMIVANGRLFWTNGTTLYGEGVEETISARSGEMTLATDGQTLYVGNTGTPAYDYSSGSSVLEGKPSQFGYTPVRYVDNATQLISSKENNQTLIYRMYQNQVEHVQ